MSVRDTPKLQVGVGKGFGVGAGEGVGSAGVGTVAAAWLKWTVAFPIATVPARTSALFAATANWTVALPEP